jgi:hypothetical protein
MSIRIEKVNFEGEHVIFQVSHKKYRIELWQLSERLLHATERQRHTVSISPGGFSVTWPLLEIEMSSSGMMQMGQPYWG